MNQLAQIAAVRALVEHDAYYAPYIAKTNAARDAFVAELRAAGIDARSGGAGNFACVRVADGNTAALCARLEDQAIYVRDISARFPGFVRITIGLDMARVTAAIIAALASSRR